VDHGYVRERLDLARVVDSSFAEVRERGDLPDAIKRKILGDNAVCFLGL
jgi:hypothetical protein